MATDITPEPWFWVKLRSPLTAISRRRHLDHRRLDSEAGTLVVDIFSRATSMIGFQWNGRPYGPLGFSMRPTQPAGLGY